MRKLLAVFTLTWPQLSVAKLNKEVLLLVETENGEKIKGSKIT